MSIYTTVLFAILVLMVQVLILEWRLARVRNRMYTHLSLPARHSALRYAGARIAYQAGQFAQRYLVSEKDRQGLTRLLVAAGFFKPGALTGFLLTKFSLMLGVILLSCGMVLSGSAELNAKMALFTVLGAFGFGVLTETVLKSRAQTRQERISQFCPDAMEMLVICAEAGAGLDLALHKVSTKISPFCPELGEELRQVVDELKVLPNRGQALKNLAARTQVDELKMLATTLYQAMNYGTSIAKSLRIIASDTRQKRLLSMEEKAAKVPAKMGLPLILLVLFPTLVLIAAPAIIGLIDSLT
jgi:tight adherence protein C